MDALARVQVLDALEGHNIRVTSPPADTDPFGNVAGVLIEDPQSFAAEIRLHEPHVLPEEVDAGEVIPRVETGSRSLRSSKPG